MCPWTASRPGFPVPVLLLVLALAWLVPAAPAQALTSPEWRNLVERLSLDGFDWAYLDRVFSDPALSYDPQFMVKKMNSLLRTRLAKARPAQPGGPPPADVYDSFLRPEPLAEARAYLKDRAPMLRRLSARYEVPQEVLVAMLLIETRLGTKVGDRGAMAPLASMAATTDVARIRSMIKPPNPSDLPLDAATEAWLAQRTREKADWAYDETAALLRYARTMNRQPMDIPGSIYGAIGFCQFMPTNIDKLGVDGDGDGKVDLFNHEDALASMANYLHKNGWSRSMNTAPPAHRGKKGERVYNQRMMKTVYTYNHSWTYCRTILAVAAEIKHPAPAPAAKPQPGTQDKPAPKSGAKASAPPQTTLQPAPSPAVPAGQDKAPAFRRVN